jgi:hypothetical protein
MLLEGLLLMMALNVLAIYVRRLEENHLKKSVFFICSTIIQGSVLLCWAKADTIASHILRLIMLLNWVYTGLMQG